MGRRLDRSWTPGAWGLILWAWLAPTAVFAQGLPSAAEAPREGEVIRGDTGVAEIAEVERGLYVGLDAGGNYYFPVPSPGSVLLNEDWLSPGSTLALRAGYDLLHNLQVELFVLASFNERQLKAEALADGNLTGDLAHLAPGVGVRFDFVTSKRLFLYTRGGIGYALWFPAELAGGAIGSLHTEVGLGVEYYTQLRHISVGVETRLQALWFPNAYGVHITPTLKYTF